MRERRELVFVGGTGRSGTHVVARLLGEHSRFAAVPIECRFHCNPSGLADVVTGRATPEEFVRQAADASGGTGCGVGGRGTVRLRARWRALGEARGARSAACTRSSPASRFEEAIARFEATAAGDVVAGLPRPVLRPARARSRRGAGKPALVEMSCFTIAAAPGLARIFPRRASSTRCATGATRAPRRSPSARRSTTRPTPPRGSSGGRAAAAAPRRASAGWTPRRALHVVSLDELVWGDRERAYGGLLELPRRRRRAGDARASSSAR